MISRVVMATQPGPAGPTVLGMRKTEPSAVREARTSDTHHLSAPAAGTHDRIPTAGTHPSP